MDLSEFLKLVSIAITAILGVIGVFVDFSIKPEHRSPVTPDHAYPGRTSHRKQITPWGWFAATAILISGVFAIYVQYSDSLDDKRKREALQLSIKSQTDKVLEVVEATSKTLAEVKRAESLLTSFDFHIDFDAACDAPTFKGFCNEIVFGPFSFGSLVTPPPGKITANLHVNIYKNSPAANTNFSFDLPISLNALHFSRYKPNSDRKIAVLSEPVKPENLRNDGAFISLRDLYGATIVISAWGASCGERCDSEQTFKDIRNNFIPSKLRISLPDGEGIDIDKMVAEKGDYVFNVNAEGG